MCVSARLQTLCSSARETFESILEEPKPNSATLTDLVVLGGKKNLLLPPAGVLESLILKDTRITH